MRATIRQTNLATLHEDVDKAMTLLEIDDNATYHQEAAINYPGQTPLVTENVMAGIEVRKLIRVQLQVAMHEVEQNDPATITLRWARASKRNNYRTQSSTYTKVC